MISEIIPQMFRVVGSPFSAALIGPESESFISYRNFGQSVLGLQFSET